MALRRPLSLLLRAALLSAAATSQALAHHQAPNPDEIDEFASTPWSASLAHPLSGADHWLAALAVGLLACSWGRPAATRTAAAFTLSLGAGIAAARLGASLPWMEFGLAASVGLAGVAAARRCAPRPALALASAIGAWHGLAHGAEMPATSAPLLYALGLTLSSGTIALAAACAATAQPPALAALPRWAGATLAAVGAGLLFSNLAA